MPIPKINENAIAVVGMAGRFPGAESLEQFWDNLRNGVESITALTPEELRAAGVPEELLQNPTYVRAGVLLDGFDRFDAGFFGFSPRDAEIMDPQHRVFLECAWEALERAGHDPSRFRGSVGVFAGSGMASYMTFNLAPNAELMTSAGLFLVRHTGNDKDFLATRVSYEFDLKGPSINVQTACSTSLVAIHIASQHLLNGECDMALAGGVTIEVPHGIGYLYKEGEILSPDGHCRPFDAESRGTVFGSGAGVVVLRRLADAIADGDHIHAVILGSAVNNDGSGKVGYLAPSVDGQAAAIVEALSIAAVDPATVTFVEAHGTGTPVGDPIEITALTEAFRKSGSTESAYCAVGSLKSNIGHLDTAAGVAGFIKTALALEHGELPPTLHFRSPNPAVDFAGSPFFVNSALQAWQPKAGTRRAGISSLGVGGTNAHVILEEAPNRPAPSTSRPWQIVPLSAKTESALDVATSNLSDHLRGAPGTVADVAWTLQVGRREFACRRFVVARDSADCADALERRDGQREFSGVAAEQQPSIAFMFAGGGAQHPNMARDLYESEPVFRAEIDRCLTIVGSLVPRSLKALLFPERGQEDAVARELERPSLALPALFAVQYAQARLWESWGVRPDAMIGHSMGEYTAACLAGTFTLEDALSVVALRGRLFETLPPGAMISVPLDVERVRGLLDASLSIAAANAPELTVVSGPVDAIRRMESRLASDGIECRRIHISVAAHSSMLEPILSEFRTYLRRLRLSTPRIPFVSNLTGSWAGDEVATADYWVRHLRETVRFADGLKLLLENRDRAFLEVGPGKTLATLAGLHDSRGAGHAIYSSLPRLDEPVSDAAFMLTALGHLWTLGTAIEWSALHTDEMRRRVVLPTYPFERQRYWIDSTPSASVATSEPETERRSGPSEWLWQRVWRRETLNGAAELPSRAGTLVFDNESVVSHEVRTVLGDSGERVVRVRPGDSFADLGGNAFTIRPGNDADAASLVRTLALDGGVPGRVLHLWTHGDPTDARTDRELGLETIIGFARALGSEDVDGATSLIVASSGSFQVAGEDVPAPVRAMLAGALRVLPREFPGLRTRFIDVGTCPHAALAREIATRIVHELRVESSAPADVVAYRGRERLVLDFEPVTFAAHDSNIGLRTCGVYLITGGLGGIGGAVAKELARRAQAKLSLVSRNALPPREDWALWLATHDATDDTARRVRLVMEMEEAGAEVLVIAADVSTPEGAARAVSETRRRFGAIQGIIHGAGVLEDSLVQTRSRDGSDRVLAPKVDAVLALERALENADLDFFISFSSVSVLAGLIGQADYAAANAFLDAHAGQRSARSAGRNIALAWSAWKGVGMLARPLSGGAADEPLQVAGEPISIRHPFLERGGKVGEGTSFVARISPEQHWVIGEHRLREGSPLMPGTGYLEIIRAAFATAFPRAEAIEMADVFFLTPFVVPEGSTRDLRIDLKEQEPGVEFVVSGRAGIGEWEEHVRGVVRAADVASRNALRLDDIRKRCASSGSAPAEHSYLQFGPRWGNVEAIHYGRREALVALRLPPAFTDDLAVVPLHPALLDMATAGAQALIDGINERDGFFVPIGYGRIHVAGPLSARMYSHVRYRAPEDPTSEVAVFDVEVSDTDGNILVSVGEFTMKLIRAETLRTHQGTPRQLVDLDEAISPEEGVAAFFRVLAVDAPANVVVSPRPLNRLLQDWRRVESTTAEKPKARLEDPTVRRDLERISAALEEHEAVERAVALAKKGRGRSRRIIAYVVYKPGEMATVSELRRYAKKQLSSHLVPSHFMDLEKFPVKADGVVDESALPDPFGPVDHFVAPRSAMEQAIAEIWREVLGVERVGLHDNFFDIGGHSLLAVRVITKVDKKIGVRLDHAIMVLHTLEQIAAKCEQRMAASTATTTAQR